MKYIHKVFNDSKELIKVLTIILGIAFLYGIYENIYYLANLQNVKGIINTIISIFVSSSTFIYFLLLYVNYKKKKENNFNKYYILTMMTISILSGVIGVINYNIFSRLINSINYIVSIVMVICLYKIFFNKTKDREKTTKILVTTILIRLTSTILNFIISLKYGISLLSVVFLIENIIVDILLIHYFNYYDIHYDNLFHNGNKKVAFYFDLEEWKKYLIAVVVIVVILNLNTIITSMPSSSKSSSKWNSLTKEEKAWYERNYGNGKSEAYEKAIENYKKNH